MYVLQQLYREVVHVLDASRVRPRVSDASHMHFRCVLPAFQMHANVTLELSCPML